MTSYIRLWRFTQIRAPIECLYSRCPVALWLFTSESFSSRPIWWHMMGVAIPDVIVEDVSYLYIEGGNNNPGTGPPGSDDGVVGAARLYARLTGYFAAFLQQVPNQPIIFTVRIPLAKSFWNSISWYIKKIISAIVISDRLAYYNLNIHRTCSI